MAQAKRIADPIHPTRVRYIKLGEGGKWEKECRDKGIIRFGFESGVPGRLSLCRSGRWDDLRKTFLDDGKSKGTATRFTNETQIFFEDDGTMLWITFMGEELYWGFLESSQAQPHADGQGVWRTVAKGWCRTDISGEPLTKDRLSGALTKLAAYQGTTCNVDVAAYVIRRINGEKLPVVEDAIAAQEQVKTSVQRLMQLLEPQDFELLVDLVFSTSGWRRLGIVGKTQKTLDLDIMLPTTGERAIVQVKSETTPTQLTEWIQRFDDLGPYDRMFFVFHSGKAETDDERVTVIGPKQLAELVMEAGLVNWLIRKVS